MPHSHPSLAAFPEQPSELFKTRSTDHNLPASSTRLIGREQHIEIVAELLRRPDVRLLTLIGPPGIGKTRLAIHVAANLPDNFPDGICFVPLASISDPDLVVSELTQVLDIRETSDRQLHESLKGFLQSKQMLLLLDNFEQVVAAAPLLVDLLAECPGIKALVTSRERLHLYGELDYPVPPLSLPSISDLAELPGLEALSQYEAIDLFLQRAQEASPGFHLTERNAHSVAEICLRLDGLPLAIELAAARMLVLPPEELLARLKSSLSLLTGGARNLPERQRTLRATIDWSYNLLNPDDQVLFRRLGVFVGGCTLEAIEEVCGRGSEPGESRMDALDGVTSLIGKSLLQRQEGAEREPRFMMLETIREYAREKLEERGELDFISDGHCDYFLRFAENAEQKTLGSETALWMRRLDVEQNNLRAALAWSLSRDGRAEMGLRLVGALARYWQYRGYSSEGRLWCTQLLSKTESRPGEGLRPGVERAKALRALARMNFEQGDSEEAHRIYEQSLAMFRALGDDWGVGTVLLGLGSVAMWQGEYDFSRSLHEECLAIGRRIGSRLLISNALSMIGVILMRQQEYQAAQPLMAEALAIDRELGNDAGIADTLIKQGSVAIHLGEHERAKALIEESLGIAHELGMEWIIAISLARLSMIALRQGDPHQAEALLLEGVGRARNSGIKRWSRWYLVGLAEVARLGGLVERAAKLIGASEGVISAAGAHYEPATDSDIYRIIASVRAEFDEETFTRLWEEGRAMSLEAATAFALEPVSGATPAPERTIPTPEYNPTASPTRVGTISTKEGQQTYPDDLTEREVEVLRLIAAGKSNQEIGQQLVLSRRTVERHISNIYQKIGASGKVARATATGYALRHGLAL